MARNIEIKARITSIAALHHRVAALAQHRPESIDQDDTFFRCNLLNNLVGNALHHAGSAEVSVSTAQGLTRVFVDDRGPGIPPGQLDAVFKPFYRLAASDAAGSTGSGLGLHIARDLLLRQGGQLLLANRPGGGLRAEVVLPSA